MTWLETNAPYLAGIAAIMIPSPLSFLKGRTSVQLPIEEIRAALQDAQKLVKLALEFIPGDTVEADTAGVLALVEPAVSDELVRLALPGVVSGVVIKLLELAVAAEVKAAYAA